MRIHDGYSFLTRKDIEEEIRIPDVQVLKATYMRDGVNDFILWTSFNPYALPKWVEYLGIKAQGRWRRGLRGYLYLFFRFSEDAWRRISKLLFFRPDRRRFLFGEMRRFVEEQRFVRLYGKVANPMFISRIKFHVPFPTPKRTIFSIHYAKNAEVASFGIIKALRGDPEEEVDRLLSRIRETVERMHYGFAMGLLQTAMSALEFLVEEDRLDD